jgi:hypothetical protein
VAGERRFAALRRRLTAAMADRGFSRQAAVLDRVTLRPEEGTPLPVLSHLEDAVARAAEEVDDDLAAVLGPLAAAAGWRQTAAYVRDPPDPSFLGLYGHAVLGGAPGVAVGLLLLGPGVRYPPHHHPAEEFYLPAATVRWVHAAIGSPAPEPAGVLVHHAPWQPHEMATDGRPALLAYVWTGDVGTPSAFLRRAGVPRPDGG